MGPMLIYGKRSGREDDEHYNVLDAECVLDQDESTSNRAIDGKTRWISRSAIKLDDEAECVCDWGKGTWV